MPHSFFTSHYTSLAASAVVLTILVPASVSGQVPTSSATPVRLLTKDQAVALALQRNQSLRAQRLTIDESRAEETTAGLKPNLVFTSTNQDFPVFTPGQLTFSNLANNQTFTESVSYLLERGGKRDRRVQVARDTTEMTARTVDDAERQVRFQVGQAFVNVLLAKATLEFAQQDLKEFTEVVELNKRRASSGDLAEGDYLKIALQKLQFEQDVSAAEVALIQAKASLRQLAGYDTVAEDFDISGELAHRPTAVSLEVLQREALAARPDLQSARVGTKVADSTLSLAQADRVRDVTWEVEYRPQRAHEWARVRLVVRDPHPQPEPRRGRPQPVRRGPGPRDRVGHSDLGPDRCRQRAGVVQHERKGRVPLRVRLPGAGTPVA